MPIIGNRAPISVGIIVKNDPHIENCILSFRDYVDELIIVDTGSDDGITPNICKKYADIFEIFTDCNDEAGKINDFSMARNRTIKLAKKSNWFLWADSDDVITGAELLGSLLNQSVDCFIFPYEYSYNHLGQVLCRQYRERLFRNNGKFHFINPVHEVLVPKEGTAVMQMVDNIVFKHKRQYITKPVDPSRNLRILKQYVEKHPDDVRNMYYIGLEYNNNGDKDNAIKYLTMYIEKSGWDDEKHMAAQTLVSIYEAKSDYTNALKYAIKELETKSDWFESYFDLCRVFYHRKQWKQASDFGRLALTQGKTNTLLFVDESKRTTIHEYLNVALNGIGDISGALESVKEYLKINPNNPNMQYNKTVYENFLGIKPVDIELEPLNKEHLNIVFVTGQGPEAWSPESIKKTGIGGSEIMLINMAKNLAVLGHKVTVYASCAGTFDGVEYKFATQFGHLACDILVVSRYAQFLSNQYNVNARIKLLWCHDVCAIGANQQLLTNCDRVLALSEWHKQNLLAMHNLHPDKVIVTRNGIDLDRFARPIKKNKYKCVNSSSPDRSWPVLLEIWPKILEKVPEARLHLYYGFSNWRVMAANDPLQMDLIKRLEDQIKITPGVVFHDRINQDELADEFQSAGCLLHPTWFTETSGITFMEGRVADLWIVTTPLAALPETLKDYDKVKLIEGNWTDPDYQQRFIKATVEVLTNEM